jgi:GPH family glycoside/pentoside/hexuronide:cation symporter
MAGKVVFAYVALILLEVVFGIVSITTGALIPLMTRQPHEKMQLSSIRTFGGSVGTFVVTGLTMPIVSLFGDNLQRGLGYAAAIFASMISLSLLVVFKNCKERYGTPLPPQNGALGNAFHNLLRNRTWQVTNAFALLTLLRLGALIASTAFFCIQVLHQPKMISILLPLLSVASLCAAPLAPAYFRKTGIRFGIIVLLASSIGLFGIMPFLEGRVWVFLSAYTLAQAFSVGPSATAAFAMAANSVDHQQWLHGARSEGLVFASLSVAVKVGIAIGTSLTGYALAWAGFDALHPSNSAAGAIRAVYYGVPMVVMAMQIVCISFYNMDRIHPQIVADLNARSKMALAFPDPENTGAAV